MADFFFFFSTMKYSYPHSMAVCALVRRALALASSSPGLKSWLGHFLAGDPEQAICPFVASVFSSVQWGQTPPLQPSGSHRAHSRHAVSASLRASHPRVLATCPASRGNLRRPHVPDAAAGQAPGPRGGRPPILPPCPAAPALPPYPGGRRAGIGPAGEPGQRGRAPERGARARAGRAGARAARSGPCAPRPPRPRLQRGPRAPRPARGQALRSAAPGGGRASRALERRPGGAGSRRARAAPLRWPRC